MLSHDFVALKVVEVVRETADAVSIVLDVPPSLQSEFTYEPGQFLTVRLTIGDKRVKRCYSLSSSPHVEPRPVITVKRVVGGLVSNALCSDLIAGDMLECAPPSGLFVPKSLDTDFVLFAGGSGITPVLSIAKSVLARGEGNILLIYANRDEPSIIFREALKQMAQESAGRLTVVHWLESLLGLPGAPGIAPLLKGWLGAEAYMCGPALFMAGVTQALEALGMDHRRIHTERFVSLPDEVLPMANGLVTNELAAVVTLQVTIDGAAYSAPWHAGEKMLDALLAAGIDAPYSCRVGGCSTCMCRVTQGQVDMAANLVLDERELADGWVLSCQALPKAQTVHVEVPS